MASDFRKSSSRYQKYFLNIKAVYSTRQDLRMFLEIILSIVAVSFFIFFAIKPTIVTVSKLLTEIKDKENTSTQLTTKIQNLQIAQQVYQANLSRLAILNSSIPDNPNPDQLIRQIQGIAQTNNLEIVKITAEDIDLVGESPVAIVPKIDGFRNIQISFIVSGAYSDVVTFIRQIENMRRPLMVNELIINSSADQGKITVSAVTEGIYLENK